MDHEQIPILELDGHDLQGDAITVIAEIHEPRHRGHRRAGPRLLLEDEAAVFDDETRAITRDPVPRRRATPREAHAKRLGILSDNISASRTWRRFRALRYACDMRPGWSAVCALVACLASLTSLPPATASVGIRASATTASVSTTAAENHAAAEAAAASLLAQFPPPPGATPSATEPANDDSLLAKPPLPLPQTPNLVDDSAWLIVSEAPSAALLFIRSHLPAGAQPLVEWPLVGPNFPANERAVFTLPMSGGGLVSRRLAVVAVQLPGGTTGLRVDSEVVWETPRPASEVIPSGARVLKIEDVLLPSRLVTRTPNEHILIEKRSSTTGSHGTTLARLVVTSPSKIQAISSLLNSLPVLQPSAGIHLCRPPARPETLIRLAFYAHHESRPLAVATAHPDGSCGGPGGITLTLHGQPQPGLEGAYMVLEGINRILGTTLKSS